MSIAAFVQAYIRPSRWWRRGKSIEVTIWPSFLAQALCPHIHQQPIMWDTEHKTVTRQCIDCHKRITVADDCPHSKVVVSAWSDKSGAPAPSLSVPTVFRCQLCGFGLLHAELPQGALVDLSPMQANDSAARDH